MRSSKESLKILFDNACNDKEGFIPLMNESYLNVEKDLEILEILKKHIKLKEVDGLFTQFKPYDIKMTILDEDDDFLKVKEWLENE